MKYWFPIAISCLLTPSWADARDELSQRLAALGHLAADFTQRIEGPGGELLEASSGRVRLLPPKFRWEVTAPYPQVLVADEQELRLYDPDLEQVTVRPIAELLDDTPLALLTRETTMLGEAYDIDQRGGDSFSVRPRSEDALFAEIVLAFGQAGLTGIRIHDHLGQTTFIRFSGFQDKSVIQSADFELSVPPGTDVF